MKANEAPKKIYIQSFNISEEVAKFDKSKMFFDDVWTEEPEPGQENIEYIRTDAFIKKFECWMNENFYKYSGEFHEGILAPFNRTEDAIEDFKDYMEGETNGV